MIMTPTKTLAVRAAALSDVDALIELIQYAYRGGKPNTSWTGEEHLVKGPRITPDKLRQIIQQPQSAVLLCELVEDGGKARIVGCIHVYKEKPDSKAAHIAMLAVDPDQQSAGVGRRLMRSMEDYARRHFDAEALEGEVISGRPELMEWYARMGYTPTGKTAPFLGPEHGVTPLIEGLHFVLIAKSLK
jgi:N-acetylglutamate synthase-like GNAT family acetyltransferase